jgi:AMP deaminase
MKKKMKTSGDMHVYKTKDGRIMTLKEVFDELKITAYDLSVDMLGVHAVRRILNMTPVVTPRNV